MPPRRRGGGAAPLALALSAAAALLAAPRPAAAKTHTLAQLPLVHIITDPLAVCNDGSRAGYFYRQSSAQDTQFDWLVYLQGGDWCYSEETCNARANSTVIYMSSQAWPWEITLGGAFDSKPAKSPWATYNKVLIGYCSSDAWMGDVGPSDATFGFSFRGRRIIAAALQQLVVQHGMGTKPAGQVAPPRLVFGGCSAGARGAMVNLDFVAPTLQSLGVEMQVAGLLDSGMWLDAAPADPSLPSLADETLAASEVFNASSVYGAECAAAYPSAPWRCLMGQYRMPFLKTPYLANEAQFDSFQLQFNENAPPPYNASALAYALGFQAAMAKEALSLPVPAQPNSSFFSAACYKHCVTDNANFWSIGVQGVSLRDLAFKWWQSPALAPRHVVDSCTGWKCGMCRENLNRTERINKHEAAVVRADVHKSELQQEEMMHGGVLPAAPPMTSGQRYLTPQQQARQHKRQARKATPDQAELAHRVEGIVLVLIGGIWACLFAGWLARCDVDRHVRGVMASERAPAPAAERPDSPNAIFGQRAGGYKTFAPPMPAQQQQQVQVQQPSGGAGAHGGYGAQPGGYASERAGPASGGVASSRYASIGGAGGAPPGPGAGTGGGGILASLGGVAGIGGAFGTGTGQYGSQASLSLEAWRPSLVGGGGGAGGAGGGAKAAPPPAPGTWAAAAAAAQAAAAEAAAQAQVAAQGVASSMLPQQQQPGWHGSGSARQLGDRL